MEIINRQQKRINKAGAKIAGLEDEEASLRGFLDELEASKAMMKAGEKQEIVWHTIREIRASYKSAAVGREEAKAKAKEKEKAKEGGGGGGSGGGGGGREVSGELFQQEIFVCQSNHIAITSQSHLIKKKTILSLSG